MGYSPIPRYASLILAAVLTACVNLKEVREYSAQAAQLTSYPELTQRWVDTYPRSRHYMNEREIVQGKAEDAGRREVHQDALKIHETVALYFAVLGKLAGDDTFSVSSNLDDLSKQIRTSKVLGIEQKQVDAYTNIVKVVSTWMVGAYQQQQVARMIEQGNASLQTLLEAMRYMARIYAGTLRNERSAADNLLLVAKTGPQDRIIAMLASAEHARISSELNAAEKRLKALDAALVKIAGAHQKLYDSRGDIDRAELQAFLKSINKDLKVLNNQIKTLKEV